MQQFLNMVKKALKTTLQLLVAQKQHSEVASVKSVVVELLHYISRVDCTVDV